MARKRHDAQGAYVSQPPVSAKARRGQLGHGLLFSSAYPQWFIEHNRKGYIRATAGSGSTVQDREFSNNPAFGRTLKLRGPRNAPIQFPGVTENPLNTFSVMLNFRKPASSGTAPTRTAPVGLSERWVSITGNDANPGTEASPYRHLEYAIDNATPGQVIRVKPGVYNETWWNNVDGTSTDRITVWSEVLHGAKITPTNTPNVLGVDAVWALTGDYITIDGFEIDGTGNGIVLNGIYIGGTGCIVNRCHVHHIAQDPALCTSTGGSGIVGDSFYVADAVHEITNNIVHHIGSSGCTFIHGIYHSGIGSVKNNLIHNIGQGGVHLWHNARSVDVCNNTIFNCGIGVIVGGGDYYGAWTGPADNIKVHNNVIANCSVGVNESGDNGASNTFSNNTLYNVTNNWQLEVGRAHTNTLTSDPAFANYRTDGSGNYTLLEGSPSINSGTATGAPSTDHYGVTRSSVDRGAYAYPPFIPARGKVMAFGGVAQGGWGIGVDTTITIEGDGINDLSLTLPSTLADEVDYTGVLVVDGTAVEFYYGRKDSYNQFMEKATGTLSAPLNTASAQNLTIGAMWDTASGEYVDHFTGDVGAISVWSRKLQPSEARTLIHNQFVLWPSADYGQFVSQVLSMSADSTTFSAASGSATFLKSYALHASPATFTLSVQNTGTLATRKLGATTATFAMTANANQMVRGRLMNAVTGSFAIVDQAATLTRIYKLAGASTNFALSGAATGLKYARKMPVSGVSFLLTPGSANLVKGAAPGQQTRGRAATMHLFQQLHQKMQAETNKKLASILEEEVEEQPKEVAKKKVKKRKKQQVVEEPHWLDEVPPLPFESPLSSLRDEMAAMQVEPGLSAIPPAPVHEYQPGVFSYANAMVAPNEVGAVDADEFSYAAAVARR